MSEFPECLDRRWNGQLCHRIYAHGGHCIYEGEAGFWPGDDSEPAPEQLSAPFIAVAPWNA